jgi:hypothetical protein
MAMDLWIVGPGTPGWMKSTESKHNINCESEGLSLEKKSIPSLKYSVELANKLIMNISCMTWKTWFTAYARVISDGVKLCRRVAICDI